MLFIQIGVNKVFLIMNVQYIIIILTTISQSCIVYMKGDSPFTGGNYEQR